MKNSIMLYNFFDDYLFENLNILVPKDNFITISGPNNCGKTTLLRILNREIITENKIVIGDALKEIGFDVGTVDWKMNEVRKMNREEYLRFLMAKDKIPEHVIEIKNDIIKS